MRSRLDLTGEVCPFTFVKTKLALEELDQGDLLEVVLDDEAALRDVPRTVGSSGHAIVSVDEEAKGRWRILIRKEAGP